MSRQTLENVINVLYKDSDLSSQVSLHGILILLLAKIKVQNNTKKCAMVNAFLLAWFIHLITKILADLTFKLFGPDAMLELFEPPKVEEKGPNEEQNGQKKPKKSHLRRRRRRASGSNENSEDDSENDSEFNDSEESNEEESDSDNSFVNDSDSDDSDIVIEEESNIITDLQMMRQLQVDFRKICI